VGGKVFRVGWHLLNKFVNVGGWFTLMFRDEHVLGKFGDLEESFRCHVLHTRVRLVHELDQLLNHRLKEGPMRTEEVRELTNHVHNISGHESFVFLSVCVFAQIQQLLDNRYDKLVFLVIFHTS